MVTNGSGNSESGKSGTPRKSRVLKLLSTTLLGGFGMWVMAGLWHNLILPHVNSHFHAHHDGLLMMLIAYFILALLMSYIFSLSYKGGRVVYEGFKIGMVIGILWVFPHGLAMAAAHGSSIPDEFKNALWHIFEQGIGGIIIAFIYEKFKPLR